jgi:hypothetical protein
MEQTPANDLKARLGQLTPEQRAALQQRLARKGAPAVAARIPRRRRAGPAPLSFCQQRLWFLDQLSPGTSTYNVPYAVEIAGGLDVPALVKSLDEIVRRHEVLRTVFASVSGTPVQVVLPKWPAILRTADLRSLPEAGRDAEAVRLLAEEGARPFRLSRDPMLRCLLVRLADERYQFLHVTHHVAWDYRSRVILYDKLAQLYEGFATGHPATLPVLPIQYADFAVWQRQRLQGAEMERLAGYWKHQLADAPASLDLPTDRPRPSVQSLAGAKYFFDLPAVLAEAAQALSRQEGVTPYMTLLAAFKAFLYLLTGQEAISVGSPVAGRDQPETEPLIGFFINTLVHHTKLSGDLTFRQLLARVREVTLGSFTHQEMPFEKLVEVVRPPRDLGRNPLFQVNFRHASAAPPILRLAGLAVEPLQLVDTLTSKFDLALELNTTLGGRSYCEYSTDLFTEATAARLVGEFEAVLRGALARPDLPLAALDLRRAQPAPAGKGTVQPIQRRRRVGSADAAPSPLS